MILRNDSSPDALHSNVASSSTPESTAGSKSALRPHHHCTQTADIVFWTRRSALPTRNNRKASREYQLQQLRELDKRHGVRYECLELHGNDNSALGSDAPVGLERLISHVKAGNVAVVVARSADRLSRSQEHLHRFARMLTAAGSYLVVGEDIDRSPDAETGGVDE
jgi:hypothetical protein